MLQKFTLRSLMLYLIYLQLNFIQSLVCFQSNHVLILFRLKGILTIGVVKMQSTVTE